MVGVTGIRVASSVIPRESFLKSQSGRRDSPLWCHKFWVVPADVQGAAWAVI